MNTLNDIIHRGDKLGAMGWSDSTQSDIGYISMEGFAGLSRSASASRLTKGADSSNVGKLKGKVNEANKFFIRCASETQLNGKNGKNGKMQLPPKMQGLLSQSPRLFNKDLLNAEDDSPCYDRNRKNPVSAVMLDVPLSTRNNPSKLRRKLEAALLHAEQPEVIDALAAARQMTFRNPFESYYQQHFQTLSAPTMTNIYGAFQKAGLRAEAVAETKQQAKAEGQRVTFVHMPSVGTWFVPRRLSVTAATTVVEETVHVEVKKETVAVTFAHRPSVASWMAPQFAPKLSGGVPKAPEVICEETVHPGISQEAEDSELWLRTLAFEALFGFPEETVRFGISQEAEDSELWLRALAFEALFASFDVSSEETVRFGISQEAEDSELWLRTLAFEALFASSEETVRFGISQEAEDSELWLRTMAFEALLASFDVSSEEDAAPVVFRDKPSVGSWMAPRFAPTVAPVAFRHKPSVGSWMAPQFSFKLAQQTAETVRFGISQEAEDSELWLRTLAFEALLASSKDVEVMQVVAFVAPVAAAPVPFKLRPSVGSWYKQAVFKPAVNVDSDDDVDVHDIEAEVDFEDIIGEVRFGLEFDTADALTLTVCRFDWD